MTGAVRTERGVGNAAHIFNTVTTGTSLVDGLIVQADPIGIKMRLGLDSAAIDLNICHQVFRIGHDRDRMT